jgi:thiamine biosynthesis lipoprotein
MNTRNISVTLMALGHRATFAAMASDCELLIQCSEAQQAKQIAEIAAQEVWRLQDKYSRYQADAWLARLNASDGQWFPIDQETSGLLDFADQIFELSEGMFDLTSGVLRKVWRFDGGNQLPSSTEVAQLTSNIGWQKIQRTETQIRMPKGFELDLGGLVKEWAADKALALVQAFAPDVPVLINLGGDLRVSGPQINGQPWQVGVKSPGFESESQQVSLSQGALTTSGDENRFILHQGKRYGHLLNPKTGWPVEDAASSVTVAAPTCLIAGVLSSLALLKGKQARHFLEQQGVTFWLVD